MNWYKIVVGIILTLQEAIATSKYKTKLLLNCQIKLLSNKSYLQCMAIIVSKHYTAIILLLYFYIELIITELLLTVYVMLSSVLSLPPKMNQYTRTLVSASTSTPKVSGIWTF